MGEDRGYPIDSQGGSFYVWEKNRNTVINGNDPDRSCVSSVAVHAQTGYAAEYAQEASAAGVQSTAKLVAKAPAEVKLFTGCTPMETCRYREKGRLRLPMIFHTDQQ